MSLITLNGLDVLDLALVMPRRGVWHGWLRVDWPDPVAGQATLSINGGALTLTGTVKRAGAYLDASLIRVVGGHGGLYAPALPKFYTATPLRIPLTDILTAAGETLSDEADQTVLGTSLGSWTTLAVMSSRAINALLEDAVPAASWRLLPDGSFWAGVETWPDSGMSEGDDYQLLDSDPALLQLSIASEAPLLRPGTLLDGQRVSRVEHRVDAQRVRSTVYLEASP